MSSPSGADAHLLKDVIHDGRTPARPQSGRVVPDGQSATRQRGPDPNASVSRP